MWSCFTAPLLKFRSARGDKRIVENWGGVAWGNDTIEGMALKMIIKFIVLKKILFVVVFTLLGESAVAQNTVLWSVKKLDSDRRSYVMGTFHQMGNWFVDEKPLIRELLLASEVAVFESVEDRKQKIRGVMLDRADDFTYRTILAKDDLALLSSLSKDWEVPISKHKPAELLVRIEQQFNLLHCGTVKSTDTVKHLDNYLQGIAVEGKVRTYGLETYADQMATIDRMTGEALTWEKAKDLLPKLLFNFRNDLHKDALCLAAEHYMLMNFDYQFEDECYENDVMLAGRNRKWMPQIKKLIEENDSVFIAVGFLHLYGKCGIVSELRNMGYEVEPVYLN